MEKRKHEKDQGQGRWAETLRVSDKNVKKDLSWIKNKAGAVLKDLVGPGKEPLESCKSKSFKYLGYSISNDHFSDISLKKQHIWCIYKTFDSLSCDLSESMFIVS